MFDTPESDLVRLHALARRLKLPVAWLKAEAEAGRIPSLKAGRQRLFNLQAVEQVLLQRAGVEQADDTTTESSS